MGERVLSDISRPVGSDAPERTAPVLRERIYGAITCLSTLSVQEAYASPRPRRVRLASRSRARKGRPVTIEAAAAAVANYVAAWTRPTRTGGGRCSNARGRMTACTATRRRSSRAARRSWRTSAASTAHASSPPAASTRTTATCASPADARRGRRGHARAHRLRRARPGRAAEAHRGVLRTASSAVVAPTFLPLK
jgi:hypothetical protein